MKHLKFAFLTAMCLMVCTAFAGNRMKFSVSGDGTLTMKYDGKEFISRSSIGLVLNGGTLHAPLTAKTVNGQIVLGFDCCNVVLDAVKRENGSLRLSVASIPEEIDGFVFGPFVCPNSAEAGEIIGAAWHEDGSLVCIQSLNPKTEGECDLEFTNNTEFHSPGRAAATFEDGTVYLSCSAGNMTRPRFISNHRNTFRNVWSDTVPAPLGLIDGAAVVLTCAPDAETLLSDIHEIEVEEGLPSPTIDGEWAKTSPHATDLYLVFGPSGVRGLEFALNHSAIVEQVRMAERAGAHWIYFNDPFRTWGHFEISRDQYPGGLEEFKEVIRYAREHGVNIGFHTLSNFMHIDDPFVTPVPDKDILAFDATPVLKDLSEKDTVIFIGEQMNYARKSVFNAVRIGDELIRFGDFDTERICLTGCQRGAYGTTAAAHKAGDIITHLPDCGYSTIYPNYSLQCRMADNIAKLIRDAGIRRMSFDGMEGCRWTGLGEFGCSDYVRRVFEKTGSELMCDASTPSHYRWHAHTYFNWGEPFWDAYLRGGMHNNRARNVMYFNRNLMPRMLGWYKIADTHRHLEPTLPETLEFILSRMIAFDAGMSIYVQIDQCDKLDRFLDIVKLWQDFRATVDVPAELREKMRDERSNWHLEKKDNKWILTDVLVYPEDLSIRDDVDMLVPGMYHHRSVLMTDTNSGSKDVPVIIEPFHFRIRVGDCYNHGRLENLEFHDHRFDVKADAGDYLEYNGGTTLYHYDKDYNLIETLDSSGSELVWKNYGYAGIDFFYNITGLDEGENLPITIKQFRSTRRYEFDVK